MIEINEKDILAAEIKYGIHKAKWEFKKVHKYNIREGRVIYIDIIEKIMSIATYLNVNNVFDNEIEIIDLSDENVDDNVLNILLNLIKKETYDLGLRVVKIPNNNLLYVYIDKVYNKNIYYVDDENEKEKVKKSLCCKLMNV